MAAQLELLYRKVVVIYPPTGASARKPVRARVDDGLDYMLKDDSGGAPVRAREWICHGLADSAGLPILEHRPILDGGRFAINKMIETAGRNADIDFPVHPHCLRHTTGTVQANGGMDAWRLQKLIAMSPEPLKDAWRGKR